MSVCTCMYVYMYVLYVHCVLHVCTCTMYCMCTWYYMLVRCHLSVVQWCPALGSAVMTHSEYISSQYVHTLVLHGTTCTCHVQYIHTCAHTYIWHRFHEIPLFMKYHFIWWNMGFHFLVPLQNNRHRFETDCEVWKLDKKATKTWIKWN